MSSPSTDQVVLRVTGMHCASCVGQVEKALVGLEVVGSAQVDLSAGRVVVNVEAGTDPAPLITAVTAVGYQASLAAQDQDNYPTPACWPPLLAAVMAAVVVVLAMWGPSAAWRDYTISALAITVVLGLGAPIWQAAAKQVTRLRGDMNVLVALGSGAALVTGLLTLFMPQWWPAAGSPPQALDAAAVIVAVVLVGRHLEARARRRGAGAIHALLAQAPQQATVVRQDKEWRVSIDQVVKGETVVVRAGEQVPVDGIIKDGHASFDVHLLTGESMPIDLAVGDQVSGGTLCASGLVRIKVQAIGHDIALFRLIDQVRVAQATRPPVARLADRLAGVFVPIVLLIALGTLGGWGVLAHNWALGVANAIAVMVVACPCALGLATPAAVVAGVGRAAELGIVVRDGAVLEDLATINYVALDKTGTLTAGRPKLHDIEPLEGFTPHELLALAAHVEHGSTHPLARAVLAAADECGIPHTRSTHQKYHAGLGGEAVVDGRHVLVGTAALMTAHNIDSGEQEQRVDALAAQGQSAFLVAVDGQLAGVLGATDALRQDAAAAIAGLRAQGLEIAMLSGDHQANAVIVAEAVGIETVHAGLSPNDKRQQIEQLRADGRAVAMVGDGINDAPALSAAQVGIAIGSGTDLAREAAGVCLPGHDLTTVATAIALARSTMGLIRQNLGLAFAYNLVAIPVAAGALAPLGFALNPMVAATAMSVSSLVVVLNSLRLRSWSAPAR